jgi:double-stranded uracil-DNA glycosylase
MTPARTDRPSPLDLAAARDRTIRDVLRPGLDIVFVGINPGLWSGWSGHHFARPGNRFWPALYRAGYTDRVLAPREDVTNLVPRTTASAAELGADEYRTGARRLVAKLRRHAPKAVAILGKEAYRRGFDRPTASFGRQPETIAGALVWVLPNPSGLNAHYQVDDLAREYAKVRADLEHEDAGGPDPG